MYHDEGFEILLQIALPALKRIEVRPILNTQSDSPPCSCRIALITVTQCHKIFEATAVSEISLVSRLELSRQGDVAGDSGSCVLAEASEVGVAISMSG